MVIKVLYAINKQTFRWIDNVWPVFEVWLFTSVFIAQYLLEKSWSVAQLNSWHLRFGLVIESLYFGKRSEKGSYKCPVRPLVSCKSSLFNNLTVVPYGIIWLFIFSTFQLLAQMIAWFFSWKSSCSHTWNKVPLNPRRFSNVFLIQTYGVWLLSYTRYWPWCKNPTLVFPGVYILASWSLQTPGASKVGNRVCRSLKWLVLRKNSSLFSFPSFLST